MAKTRTNVDREMVLAAIRQAAKVWKGERMSWGRFSAHSKIRYDTVRKYFASWKEALAVAGIGWQRPKYGVPAEVLLAEWGGVVRKCGHAPTHKEFNAAAGKQRSRSVALKCGPWEGLPDIFRKFAEGKEEEWRDVLALLPEPGLPILYRVRKPRWDSTAAQATRSGLSVDRLYGSPVNFRNMRHAPVNEMGVVWLFGAVSADLGFVIESIQGAFPDCVAKRYIGKEKWIVRRIEFELESLNFKEHGHAVEGCDIIVCWEHNWAECPTGIEVIALRDLIAQHKITNDQSPMIN